MFKYLLLCDDRPDSYTDFLRRGIKRTVKFRRNYDEDVIPTRASLLSKMKTKLNRKNKEKWYSAKGFEIKNFSNASVMVNQPRTHLTRVLSNNPMFLNVSMKIDRNLTLFDYKVLYVVSQLATINLSVEISEDKYKKPEEYRPEKQWLGEYWGVSRAMRYYLVGEDYQKKINFRLILYL